MIVPFRTMDNAKDVSMAIEMQLQTQAASIVFYSDWDSDGEIRHAVSTTDVIAVSTDGGTPPEWLIARQVDNAVASGRIQMRANGEMAKSSIVPAGPGGFNPRIVT